MNQDQTPNEENAMTVAADSASRADSVSSSGMGRPLRKSSVRGLMLAAAAIAGGVGLPMGLGRGTAEKRPKTRYDDERIAEAVARRERRAAKKAENRRRADEGKRPTDPKLSDRGVRRGTCMVGGKAAVEAGAVTHGAVRCSAWLGDVACGSELCAPLVVLGLIAGIGLVIPSAVVSVTCSDWKEAWSVLWRCWACFAGCGLLAFGCAVIELRFAVARADRERERRRREDESDPSNDGTTPELAEPNASLKLKLGVCALCGGSMSDDSISKVGIGLPGKMSLASRKEELPKPEINHPE